jgi:hypothetical protein
MSTYPATIRARARSRVDHSLAVWAALGIALIGAVVVLVLTVPDRDYAPPHSQAIAPHSQAIAPDSRFDGGPNEGTRGAVNRAPADSAVTRFDGGPQEGTRGAIVQYSASTRFDGGPNEGTRGR